MTRSPLSRIERDTIILNAVWDIVDEMVNYEIFEGLGSTSEINLVFKTSSHAKLFNILLGDFLSQPQQRGKGSLPFGLTSPPPKSRPSDLTYLFYLRGIANGSELFGIGSTLSEPVEAFSAWLEDECEVEKVWLPSIGVEVDLRVSRILFLKICGDIAKHNFARLEGNVERIRQILAMHGHQIDLGQGFLVLPEFYDWFHRNIFAYHASTIAEFLNNIRWAIYRFVLPEFRRSFRPTDPKPMYTYDVPREFRDPLAISMYWDLMNRARFEPFFPPFTVSRWSKGMY